MSLVSAQAQTYWRGYGSIGGWFDSADFVLFDWLLADQRRRDVQGDLLEIGAYKGKSAILLGVHRREGERFTVCDLFDEEADEQINRSENAGSYKGLTRQAFEDNYARHVGKLPDIVQGSSTEIADHVAERSVRFAHVDGSHLYDFVKSDLASVKKLVGPDHVVACDDFRALRKLGVAAAVWGTFADGFIPVAATEAKLYGTWSTSTADAVQANLGRWVDDNNIPFEIQKLSDREVVTVTVSDVVQWRRVMKSLIPVGVKALLRR